MEEEGGNWFCQAHVGHTWSSDRREVKGQETDSTGWNSAWVSSDERDSDKCVGATGEGNHVTGFFQRVSEQNS